MNPFEKIIEELKQESIIVDDDAGHRAVEIIEQIAEEYNSGWIACSERLPEENQQVILQDFYGNITIEKMKIADGVKGFSDGDWWSSANNYVAWQPLPKQFKECD